MRHFTHCALCIFFFEDFLVPSCHRFSFVGECPHWGFANRCTKLVLWMMGYHSLNLRLCHFRGILWKQICSAGSQRIVAQVVTTVGLRDYWKVGGKRALSFIVFLTCGKHWPIPVPREPISSTEEVSCHQRGLNTAWCKKKRKSQHKKKWKVRSPCSFRSRKCIGVLSSESTFDLEFCGTFTKTSKCNTLSLSFLH